MHFAFADYCPAQNECVVMTRENKETLPMLSAQLEEVEHAALGASALASFLFIGVR